jgi:hypothetical protein
MDRLARQAEPCPDPYAGGSLAPVVAPTTRAASRPDPYAGGG